MKKHEEKLREEYEDAVLAMVLHELAKKEGEELIRQNEMLKNDPSFIVPETTTQRSLETIQKAFAMKKRAKTMVALRKVLVKAACIAAILSLMTVSAYASFPRFRRAALNLMIEAEKISTRVKLGENTDEEDGLPQVDGPMVLMGYVIPELPEGFVLDDMWEGDKSAWAQYTDKERVRIKFSFFKGTAHAASLDTENAITDDAFVQGKAGLLSSEDESVLLIWHDEERDTFLFVEGEGVNSDVILSLAEKLLPEK